MKHCSPAQGAATIQGSEIPRLPAVLSPTGDAVRVWCTHCGCAHHHGSAGIADGTSPHRLAHCHKPGSPYRSSGYFLFLAQGNQA